MVFEIQYSDNYVKEAKTLKSLLELSYETVRLRKTVQDNILQLVLRTNEPSHTYFSKKGIDLLFKDLSRGINTEIKIIKKIMIS
jgi:hypothetical protein